MPYTEEKMQTATAKILVLSAALATTAAFAAAKLQTKFSDIPAGHWATEAVEAIAADGLIIGYQDGTFRGTRTLTRYEAATIFYRLLQNGKLQAMSAATQTAVQQGIAEVGAELTALTTRVTTLETGNDTRLKALEEQLGKLTAAPASSETLAATEASAALEDRIAAIEDEITNLRDAAPTVTTTTSPATATPDNALDGRITALETELAALKTAAAAPATATSSSDLEARLKALEDKVAATPVAPATITPAAFGDVTARLTALETKVAALPTAAVAPTDTSALTATVAAQNVRIDTLETALSRLQADVAGLKTAAVAITTTTTTPATTGSSATISATNTSSSSGSGSRFSLGLGGATNISGPVGAGASPFGLYGQLGLTNLIGPIGLRAFADLSSVPTAGVQLMLSFGDGGFDPYVGLGGGVIFSSPTNFFLAGSVGANLGLGGGLGLFAEINPRYNLSASQFSIKAAFGVRFSI